MRAPITTVLASLVSLAWLAGCASPASSPASNPSASAIAIPESACPAIELRSPSGEPVHLTDRWRGLEGGTYYLRQSASCVFITGFSVGTGAPGGEGTTDYTNAFFGHLEADFTMTGVWADMPWGREEGGGSVTWGISFSDVGGVEATTIMVIEVTNGSDLTMVRPEADADLRVELQNAEDCTVVESDDGDEYELVVAAEEWGVVPGVIRVDGPNTHIRPGDTFTVRGEIARGTGACGDGLILFADEIEA